MFQKTSAQNTSLLNSVRARAIFGALAFISLVIFIPAAYGQAVLTFSGGSGTPLTTTVQQRISYTINNTSCLAGGPVFIFDEPGNPLAGSFLSVTGTIDFFIDGGAAQPITTKASGVTANNISANDIFIFGAQTGVGNGSTIVLSGGTVTTTSNVAGASPANGNFTTFITDGNGVRCSTDGVALPPSAASVSVSGRVSVGKNTSLRNAVVQLTDGGGNTRSAITNAFGYYSFDNVTVGETYFVSVRSKNYFFETQIINPTEDAGELNFFAMMPFGEMKSR